MLVVILPMMAVFGCCAYLLSLFLTRRLINKLRAQAVLDIPNDRSMHAIPTPRGGGLAVSSVIILGLIGLLTTGYSPALYLLTSMGLLVAISWLDDRKGASVGVRLGAHLLAATIGGFALGPNAMALAGFLPFWLDRLLVILGWAWFMNLYNFMDGIDGITGIETICCATGAALLFSVTGTMASSELFLCALIIGASAGFLKYNWHPAKIFLGDVGSVPLGFLIGFLLLKIATEGYLVAAAILPLYYLADSGITIIKRAQRGEKIWQAHRSHFYQRAAAAEQSHSRIVLWILWADMALILCGLFALSAPWLGLCLGVGILFLLLAHLSRSARKVQNS